MTELCRLCGEARPLLLSHIIPAFVFKWKRESAGGSPLRNTKNPNLRVQDGIKRYWLCAECEERFSKDERAFASRIFHPYLSNPSAQCAYGPWLLRFCVSISWRLLLLAMEDHKLEGFGPAEAHLCRQAELAWREFLLGLRPHPGEYRQHILPLDLIGAATGREATNINRYLTRMIQIDFCRGERAIFTFAKLGRFAIFGTIRRDALAWKGTQVQGNEGVVGPRDYVLPAALWRYMNEKAVKASSAMASVSDVQRAKIDDRFRKNISSFVGTDAFNAMQADVEMFGEAAFSKRD